MVHIQVTTHYGSDKNVYNFLRNVKYVQRGVYM